jgi:bifunctional ADP-heptose synthase (sugar kinase/adenylyltransferase)
MSNSTGLGKRLLESLSALKALKAVVIGDDIWDVYQEVEPVGYANKTHAPVVRRTRQPIVHVGGARAVARHMRQFCDDVRVFTPHVVVYKERVMTAPPDRHVLFEMLDLPDVCEVKRRVLYEEAADAVRETDVILCLDYGHGAFDCGWTPERRTETSKLIVNCQSNSWSRGYSHVLDWTNGARVDLLVMDENELRETLADRNAVPEAADKIHCPNMVTMGHRGLRHSEWGVVPAHAVKELDRTGAGDAALAMAALMTAANQPAELVAHSAAIMGALKASLVWGNERAVTREEYVKFVEALPTSGSPEDKIRRDAAKTLKNELGLTDAQAEEAIASNVLCDITDRWDFSERGPSR